MSSTHTFKWLWSPLLDHHKHHKHIVGDTEHLEMEMGELQLEFCSLCRTTEARHQPSELDYVMSESEHTFICCAVLYLIFKSVRWCITMGASFCFPAVESTSHTTGKNASLWAPHNPMLSNLARGVDIHSGVWFVNRLHSADWWILHIRARGGRYRSAFWQQGSAELAVLSGNWLRLRSNLLATSGPRGLYQPGTLDQTIETITA